MLTEVTLWDDKKQKPQSWEARFYLDGELFAEAYGSDREEALNALKEAITRIYNHLGSHDWTKHRVVKGPYENADPG